MHRVHPEFPTRFSLCSRKRKTRPSRIPGAFHARLRLRLPTPRPLRRESQYFLATRTFARTIRSQGPRGFEDRVLLCRTARSFINIYPHLNPSGLGPGLPCPVPFRVSSFFRRRQAILLVPLHLQDSVPFSFCRFSLFSFRSSASPYRIL